MANASEIDTARVTGRRELHFASIDDALAEAERLVALERTGQIKCLGNWTCGQIFGHLATWGEYAYNGNPLKPPLIIKLILRTMKRRFLYAPMKVGARIPKVQNGTLGTEPCNVEGGFNRYQKVMSRLKVVAPTLPNVIFGPMTHDEWINMHLRHSEFHLSFLQPAAGPVNTAGA
ncbi:hypothetical protein BH09PLA1_BH09PLA1_30500 [soil metagenome]